MKANRPVSLTVVAWLFILLGGLSVVDAVIRAVDGTLSFNTGVLALPGWIGLLSVRRGWRTFCLCVLVLGVLGSLFLAATAVVAPEKIQFFWLASPSPGLVFIAALVLMLIQVWAYRVLTRKDICALFGNESPQKTA